MCRAKHGQGETYRRLQSRNTHLKVCVCVCPNVGGIQCVCVLRGSFENETLQINGTSNIQKQCFLLRSTGSNKHLRVDHGATTQSQAEHPEPKATELVTSAVLTFFIEADTNIKSLWLQQPKW